MTNHKIGDPMLSPETLDLCCELLAKVTLSASQPDFDEQALRVSTAKRELLAAIEGQKT